MSEPNLSGRRILIVEDDYFLCLDVCTQVEDHGGVVVGPVDR
jgi:hypothetical protein